MVNKIIGELLLIALMTAATAALAISLAPPPAKPTYEIRVEDAYSAATSQELFDVIMVSGEIRYSNLKVRLVNATTGDVVDTAVYSGDLKGRILSAEIKDADGSFSTGDLLRFKGSVSPGVYRVIVIDDGYVAFDGLLRLQ